MKYSSTSPSSRPPTCAAGGEVALHLRYVAPDGCLLFQTGEAVYLLTIRGEVTGGSALAVTRDGQRILFPQAIDQPDSNVIHVMTP